MILQVYIKREGSRFVAHCLEFDVASSGEDFEDAIANIKDAICTYLEACLAMGLNSKEFTRPAPQEYFEEFQERFFDPHSTVSMCRLRLSDLLPGQQEEAAVAV